MIWGDSRLPNRFWDKVVPEPNSGCWLWIGAVTPTGYGVIGLGTRRDGNILAHRWSCSIANGIPEGMHVE